jgi:hypothetical protein
MKLPGGRKGTDSLVAAMHIKAFADQIANASTTSSSAALSLPHGGIAVGNARGINELT